MKKILSMLLVLLVFNLLALSCSGKTSTNEPTAVPTPKQEAIVAPSPTVKPEPTLLPTATPEPSATPVPTQAAALPTLSPDNFNPTASISDQIPAKYSTRRLDFCGTIKEITYDTYDYFGDNSKIQKSAYVYLPYGYDETKQYNVLYLMHGIGGNEREWGMVSENSKVKIMMDNLIYFGDIEPFIIVTPNGRSSKDYANTSSDFKSFYLFGKELRNDLIPYIDANFATYADYNKDGYDLTAARDHRAMAGLSMGGMQTINIGICECLDIISYFGAFSAAPTTYTSAKVADSLKQFNDYDINYFYNICGTADGVALASATASVSNITSLTDKLKDGVNYMWQDSQGGGHDFNVWYLGFYNFAQLAFKSDN